MRKRRHREIKHLAKLMPQASRQGLVHIWTSDRGARLVQPACPILPQTVCLSQTAALSLTSKDWALSRPSLNSLAAPPSSWSQWQPPANALPEPWGRRQRALSPRQCLASSPGREAPGLFPAWRLWTGPRAQFCQLPFSEWLPSDPWYQPPPRHRGAAGDYHLD